MHVILRNPIYSGWRVIDKKRDPSAKGKLASQDGRQVDRRKILRAPEEIIRLKVIDQPLISEQQFAQVQRIMDAKQGQHWRSRPDYEHRFTYAGFLVCAQCGDRIYTHFRRRDYYICKARRAGGTCDTVYMQRTRLEPTLDILLSARLRDEQFLSEIEHEWRSRSGSDGGHRQREAAANRMTSLAQQKSRVMDSYFEGVIDKAERDRRLTGISASESAAGRELKESALIEMPSAAELAEVFKPFSEWEFLPMSDKRALLASTVPKIHVANYQVAGVSMCRTSDSRRAAGSVDTASQVFIPMGFYAG
jgi:hypothetical protein